MNVLYVCVSDGSRDEPVSSVHKQHCDGNRETSRTHLFAEDQLMIKQEEHALLPLGLRLRNFG